MQSLYLGIDIGGTNTKIGLATLDQGLLAHHSFPTQAQQTFSDFSQRLTEELMTLRKRVGNQTIKSAGVGAPDVNFFSGMMESPPNLSWGSFSLKTKLEKILGIPVWVDNDANLFALAERDFGAAKGIKSFILVTLGTGVGTGVVINGHIVRGHNGLAGEGGHIEVVAQGRRCPCGKLGHLEAYLGAKGMAQTTWEVSGRNLNSPQIAQGLAAGDPVMLKIVEQSAEKLAIALANWVSLLGPEKIILTGGLTHLGEKFCELTKEKLEKRVFHNLKNSCQVILGKLSADHGALLGAAGLAMQMEMNNFQKLN